MNKDKPIIRLTNKQTHDEYETDSWSGSVRQLRSWLDQGYTVNVSLHRRKK